MFIFPFESFRIMPGLLGTAPVDALLHSVTFYERAHTYAHIQTVIASLSLSFDDRLAGIIVYFPSFLESLENMPMFARLRLCALSLTLSHSLCQEQ